jgi:hypothetical protein
MPRRVYLAVAGLGFPLAYVLTRSTQLPGDAEAFIRIARAGTPGAFHYGEPAHFLQSPLARLIWSGLAAMGLSVSLADVFAALTIAGTTVAVICFGLVVEELTGRREARWIGSVALGAALAIWANVNGELYGLALGFLIASLLAALSGRAVACALLFSLSMLSHADFALGLPALVAGFYLGRSRPSTRRLAMFVGAAAAATLLALLGGTRAVGKWDDLASFERCVSQAAGRLRVMGMPRIELERAIKGLITAYSAGGHFWRDVLTHRGAFDHPLFVPALVVAGLVLVASAACIAAGSGERRLLTIALCWIAPFFMFLNLWFVPTAEKYHAGALPGLVLLVTGGLMRIGQALRTPARWTLYATYLGLHAGLNFFGVILPLQHLGAATDVSEASIRALYQSRAGRAAFIACDDSRAIVHAGVPYLRLREVWTDLPAREREAVRAYAHARLDEGTSVFLVGRWCYPGEWRTYWTTTPFDLYAGQETFQLTPTAIRHVPIAQFVSTNPFTWSYGDVTELTAKPTPR